MKRIYLMIITTLVFTVLIALPTMARSKPAPTATNYDLSWYTIGGALNASGGSYSLSGTIGQLDAGSMSGGSFTSFGGFWGGATSNYNVYLPLVLKNV